MKHLLFIKSVLCIISFLLIIQIVPQPAYAQSPEKIAGFEVKGNRRVETEAILGQMRLKKGANLSAEALRQDILRIWKLGLLSDIKVDKKQTPEGIVLTFIVEEKPVIEQIILDGNDEVSDEDIQKVLDVKEYEPLALDKLSKNRQKILELYREKGFFLVDIELDVQKSNTSENARIVTFKIYEHAKVIIKKINILGNKNIKDDEIKSVIQTREGGWLSFITSSGIFQDEAFQRDLMIMKTYYMDKGYIKAKIGAPGITLSPNKEYVYINIHISEGPQYTMGECKFTGDLADEKGEKLFTSAELKEKMVLQKGDIFSSIKLSDDLNKGVSRSYRDLGYAYVNIIPYEKIDEDKKIIDFNFKVERGPKVFYERIEITGNYKTRDKVVRREIKIIETELSNETEQEISKARVKALGYFEEVELLTRRGSAPDKMIVTFNVKEKSTGSFQLSAGFSTQENFLVQAQVSQDNLLGRGQTLSFTALVSSLRQYFNLQFVEPYLWDSKFTLITNLFNRNEDFYDFMRKATGGRLSVGYPLSYNWRVFAGYSLQHINAESSSAKPTRIKNLFTDGFTSSVTGTIQYDSRDNRLFPKNGSFHYLSIEEASSIFGSQNLFTRFTLNSRWFIPIYWDIVFKTNIKMGYITSPDIDGVPLYEKYFTGGIYSIRGYQLRSISPKKKIAYDGLDPASPLFDFSVGGDKEFISNFEIEFPIVKPIGIYGVVFYDAGNTFAENEFFFFDKGDNTMRGTVVNKPPLGLFMSVGCGIRWFSPIAPFRFEWGFPLTRRESTTIPGLHVDSPILFEFTLGNPF